eukprot:TRINITY_DN5910_c0_g1_i5.p1 TRINITY_DN5910_c0_g1~~TRINITY_DN5910_c0_g1_i5.p1  ORF type:complete len:269 (-),score=89.34 TRINITY_DN5910_c0_g1_i5:132-938(-)
MENEIYVFKCDDFYVKSEIVKDGKEEISEIQLLLSSEEAGYKGKIDAKLLTTTQEKHAAKFPDKIRSMAETAFMGNLDNFSLKIEIQDEQPVLTWRRQSTGKMKILLATVNLIPVDKKVAREDIMDFLIKDRLELKEKLKDQQQTLDRKTTELDRCQNLADELTNNALERENLLVEQFLPILNNKKRRIEQLEEEIRHGGHHRAVEDTYEVETDDEADTDVDDYDDNHHNDDLTQKRKLGEESNGKGEPSKQARVDREDSLEEDIFKW